MKQEHLKQLSQTFRSFGISAKQAAEAGRRLKGTMAEWEKILIRAEHQRRCVIIAHTLASETDQFKREVIWSLFKRI